MSRASWLWKVSFSSSHLSSHCDPRLVLLTESLAWVSHAGVVGLAAWMAAWMLIGRCNKVFEVCNTLLQNHNVKIPLWIGRSGFAWHLPAPPLPLSPSLSLSLSKARTHTHTTNLSHLRALAAPHPSLPPSPSSLHLLIITSDKKTCLPLIGLEWQEGFWNTNTWDVAIRGKKIKLRELTTQAGGWIIGLG